MREGTRSDTTAVLQLGNPTTMYGAERWILALVRHMDPDRVRSIVGVLNDDPAVSEPPLLRYASDFGFETAQFDSPGRVSFAAIGQIRKYVRQNAIDILHTHGYKTDIIGRLATLGTNCRIVSTPHGWSQNAGLALQLYELLDRLAFAFVDHVVPLSVDLHEGVRKIPFVEKKLTLITNGVDISEVDEQRSEFETSRKDRKASFCVGYIGQLIHRKRLDTLIEAFSAADIEGKELVIVGDGPQRESYSNLTGQLGVDELVSFAGFQEDRLRYLFDFDVFVLPSELEGIPRCVMEAMAARVPVIASNIPGCNDIVIDSVNGLLFPVGDQHALRALLETLAGDSSHRRALADSGRQYVEEKFSAQRMADEYVELFLKIASRRQAGLPDGATNGRQ